MAGESRLLVSFSTAPEASAEPSSASKHPSISRSSESDWTGKKRDQESKRTRALLILWCRQRLREGGWYEALINTSRGRCGQPGYNVRAGRFCRVIQFTFLEIPCSRRSPITSRHP